MAPGLAATLGEHGDPSKAMQVRSCRSVVGGMLVETDPVPYVAGVVSTVDVLIGCGNDRQPRRVPPSALELADPPGARGGREP